MIEPKLEMARNKKILDTSQQVISVAMVEAESYHTALVIYAHAVFVTEITASRAPQPVGRTSSRERWVSSTGW